MRSGLGALDTGIFFVKPFIVTKTPYTCSTNVKSLISMGKSFSNNGLKQILL